MNSTETTVQQQQKHRKERANPDWPVSVYAYWIEPIGDLPEWIWLYHDEMQTLWNEMVTAHDAFVESKKASEESDFKWDADRKRIEFAAFREQLKNLAKSRKRLLPNSCYYEVRDRFLVAMGRYWNPDVALRHRRTETKNFDLGRPRQHFGRRKVLIPHDLNASNIPADIVFVGKRPLTILQRTKQQGPTRGTFQAAHNAIDFRINLHRPIPQGNIKRLALVGELIEPFGWNWSLHLTIEQKPAPVPITTGRVAAIDLGWRLMDKERIRIGVLVDNSGNIFELSLPLDFADSQIRRQIDHFKKFSDAVLPIHTIPEMWDAQAQSDFQLEACKDQLVRLIPTLLPNKAAWDKARQKSLLRLLDKVKETVPDSPAIKVIADWRRENYQHHRRWRSGYERFLRWRNEAYRVIAAAIAETYDVLILEGRLNLAEMSRNAEAPPAVKAGQKYRQWTAIHSFKQLLEHSMKKSGKELIPAKAAYSTATCSICGGSINTDSPLYLTCENGHSHDQDVNAAQNLLQSYPTCESLPKGESPDRLSQILRYQRPLACLKSV